MTLRIRTPQQMELARTIAGIPNSAARSAGRRS